MRSMTGYGRGEGDNGALKIVVEVKAVNHRYSEITIKQPRMFLALEDKMKKVIGEYIERGKVDVFVRTQELADAEKELADARIQLQDARQTIDDLEKPDVYALTRNTNLGYVVFESDSDIVAGVAKIFPVFFLAVAALVFSIV